jgi:aspartate racemase
MATVDFAEVERLQHAGEWECLGGLLAQAARSVERGGAAVILLCSNTVHKLADTVERSVRIPLLHIADVTAAAIRRNGRRRVGLLGTRFTMEEDFYVERIRARFGIEVIVPPPRSRQAVHDVIYGELCHGVVRPESREAYRGIIAGMAERGAEAVILGCTEIGLLISGKDSPLPVYDSTSIHAHAAVDFALA